MLEAVGEDYPHREETLNRLLLLRANVLFPSCHQQHGPGPIDELLSLVGRLTRRPEATCSFMSTQRGRR